MKKVHVFLIPFLILLLLSGCALLQTSGGGLTMELYYQTSEAEFSSETGALGYETRTLPWTQWPSFDELLNLYFEGPQDEHLISPFPEGMTCQSSSLDEGILTVILSDEFDTLTGIHKSVASACITSTLLQFTNVTGVCVETEKSADSNAETVVLTESDFVLRDIGAINTDTTVRIYFADANGRYLVTADRSGYFTSADEIPAFIIQQLIAGPTDAGQLAVMPEGAALREISVDDAGNCTVNFSSEFLLNRPATDLMERMTILSIVDSLTELESIKSVQFLVEGNTVSQYYHMDLSQPFTRDESAIDVVRTGMNETDATLYVSSLNGAYLTAVPVSVRRTAQTSLEQELLQRLISFEAINGLEPPLPNGTQIQAMELRDGICYVDLSNQLLESAGNVSREALAVRAVAATLCSLDDINGVKLSVNGKSDGFRYHSLEKVYTPEDYWFH